MIVPRRLQRTVGLTSIVFFSPGWRWSCDMDGARTADSSHRLRRWRGGSRRHSLES